MALSYWLINANRSKVKRFIKNTSNRDQFFDYVFIDSGKVVGILGKDPPLMKKREEVKIEEAREIWKNLINRGWRRTESVCD